MTRLTPEDEKDMRDRFAAMRGAMHIEANKPPTDPVARQTALDFVYHAPLDMQRLLTEIDALRAEIEQQNCSLDKQQYAIAKLRAENERLTKRNTAEFNELLAARSIMTLNERLRRVKAESRDATIRMNAPEILQALDDNERRQGISADLLSWASLTCPHIYSGSRTQGGCLECVKQEWGKVAADNARYRAAILQLEKERKEAVDRVHALEAQDRANEKEPF